MRNVLNDAMQAAGNISDLEYLNNEWANELKNVFHINLLSGIHKEYIKGLHSNEFNKHSARNFIQHCAITNMWVTIFNKAWLDYKKPISLILIFLYL